MELSQKRDALDEILSNMLLYGIFAMFLCYDVFFLSFILKTIIGYLGGFVFFFNG